MTAYASNLHVGAVPVAARPTAAPTAPTASSAMAVGSADTFHGTERAATSSATPSATMTNAALAGER